MIATFSTINYTLVVARLNVKFSRDTKQICGQIFTSNTNKKAK